LVTARSASGVSVSLSVAPVGVSPGGVIVAVLTRVPVAAGSMAAVKLNVRMAPTGRSTVVAKAPVPLENPVTLAPPVWLSNIQVSAVTPAGTGSESAASIAALGPALLTTTV
jgi:hypothetical protein